MVALLDTAASYEICFENEIEKIAGSACIYSTGFQMRVNGVADGITYFFEDDGDGNIYRFHFDSLNAKVIDDRNFGTVDYTKGEVLIGYTSSVTIVNTTVDNSVVEVRQFLRSKTSLLRRLLLLTSISPSLTSSL